MIDDFSVMTTQKERERDRDREIQEERVDESRLYEAERVAERGRER